MKWPKCQFNNRKGVKFCEECGAEVSRKCPQCGAHVGLRAKFCSKCGHSLELPPEPIPQALSFEEKLDRIQRYLLEGLTEKILAQLWYYLPETYIATAKHAKPRAFHSRLRTTTTKIN